MKTHKDLIKRCIKNDSNSQQEFYKLFYPRLMAVSLRMSPDRETAKDLLQDSYVKIFSNLKTIKKYEELSVFSWCKQIVNNTIIDYLRKSSSKIKGYSLDGDDEYGSHVYSSDIEVKERDMSLLHYKNLEPNDVMDAIDSLPTQYKIVFNLIVEGYTHKEVSDRLGIVEGTSKSNYAKARYRLMIHLDKVGKEEEEKLYFELN